MKARRGGATVAALTVLAPVALWYLAACGSSADKSATGPAPTTSVPATVKPSSKLPAEVSRTVAHLQAGEQPGGTGGAFTDSGVPVRDGKLQLELHAAGPVPDAQKADLTALGAEIVAAGTAVGIVDAWVPYARVEEAAALPWVVAVTVPSPTRAP